MEHVRQGVSVEEDSLRTSIWNRIASLGSPSTIRQQMQGLELSLKLCMTDDSSATSSVCMKM